MEEEYLNNNEYLTMSPEDIAQNLFSKDPEGKFTKQIFADVSNDDNVRDTSYLFEIAITILMEGINIVLGGLENLEPESLEPDHILALNPWFNSIRFKINVELVEKKDLFDYEDYYCKIILKNYGYGPLFDIKKFKKDYHFLCNQKYREGCFIENLNDMFATFVREKDVFKISFDYIKE